MLEFKPLEFSAVDKIRHYFKYSVNRTCDNTVGGAFMWRDYFSVAYAEYNDTIIFKTKIVYSDNITAFTLPLGKDIKGSIEKIIEYCRETGMRLTFCTITLEEIDILKAYFPYFEIFIEANWSDYIYHAEDLKTLSGRKFNGQRNHMNFFKREYPDHRFEVLTAENAPLAKAFYEDLSLKLNFENDVAIEEHDKTIEVLENYDAYGLFGGLLKVNDSVVAFAVGESINNVLFVHIEKADTAYRGAYQVINNEFVKHFATSETEFINREEDVGDEGLRYSKRSYHPCGLIDKYIFLVK